MRNIISRKNLNYVLLKKFMSIHVYTKREQRIMYNIGLNFRFE